MFIGDSISHNQVRLLFAFFLRCWELCEVGLLLSLLPKDSAEVEAESAEEDILLKSKSRAVFLLKGGS